MNAYRYGSERGQTQIHEENRSCPRYFDRQRERCFHVRSGSGILRYGYVHVCRFGWETRSRWYGNRYHKANRPCTGTGQSCRERSLPYRIHGNERHHRRRRNSEYRLQSLLGCEWRCGSCIEHYWNFHRIDEQYDLLRTNRCRNAQ